MSEEKSLSQYPRAQTDFFKLLNLSYQQSQNQKTIVRLFIILQLLSMTTKKSSNFSHLRNLIQQILDFCLKNDNDWFSIKIAGKLIFF